MNGTPQVDEVVKVIRGMLATHTLESACMLVSNVTSPDVVARARRVLEKEIDRIRILRDPPTMEDPAIESWYPGPSENDRYWPPLKRHLVRKGLGDDAVRQIDAASTKIVSLLHHPGLGKFQTRGLVAGDVQSGKTANFTAVIAKTADVGYRMFIVLSGITNKLRQQTQLRLEDELVGLNREHWIELTDSEHDFGSIGDLNANALLTQYAHQKTLVVIKKHSGRLAKLLRWLLAAHENVLSACPILVIDDEADQASINTSSDPEERSRVNKRISEILSVCPKVSFVGYTATPYANFFIDAGEKEGLYPRHFIIALRTPTNYFGYEKIFGRERTRFDETDQDIDGVDMIRQVPANEAEILRPQRGEVGSSDLDLASVPSLQDALVYFVMATAARLARGQVEEHSTMLIHTTQLTRIHRRFMQPLEAFVADLRARVGRKDGATLATMKRLWQDETRRVAAESLGQTTVAFDAVAACCPDVLGRLRVVVENYLTPKEERLVYGDDPGIFVVIGGDVLSRGLTLEGLVVSYFLRSATAYDTLMQMGRWFGYRRGYEDLPRIWMTDELRSCFYELGGIDMEMRQLIDKSYNGQVTPEQFAPMIRTHPGMMITSRLKMQHAALRYLSYGDRNVQTILFEHKDEAWLQANIDAARHLVTAAQRAVGQFASPRPGRWLAKGLDGSVVLDFLRRYKFHPESWNLNREAICDYINGEVSEGGLRSWNVLVVSQARPDSGEIDIGLGERIPLIKRSRVRAMDLPYANIKSLMSLEDGLTDLGLSATTVGGWEEVKRERNARAPDSGLLVLYPIDHVSDPLQKNAKSRVALDAVLDVIGVGLVFPRAKRAEPGRPYMTQDLSRLAGEVPDFVEEDEQ